MFTGQDSGHSATARRNCCIGLSFVRSPYRRALAIAGALLALALPACQHQGAPTQAELAEAARAELSPRLERLGARNWIVIADPTCPVLAGAGVEVAAVQLDSAETFRQVLDLLELQGSLTPRVWVGNELYAVPERRAPGITKYREALQSLLNGRFHYSVDTRIIDMQLAQAAAQFSILYIKTATRLPYSSIAIELDSGYWNPDAESELRDRMQRLQPQPAPLGLPAAAKAESPASTPQNPAGEHAVTL